MVKNKSSKSVWMKQAAVGTTDLDAVNDVTYEFGEYNAACGNWGIPNTENPTEDHWDYNSGTPTLVNNEREYPTFKRTFLPVTAQIYAWFQGKPVDADPNVNISTLTSGMTYPLTIRIEELEGTHPDVVQAVDCYCVALLSNAERDKEFMVEAEFAFGKLEDIDPGGDNRPVLTTAPSAAGLMTGAYNGNPILEWNSVSIPGVEKAVWAESKKHTKVSADEGVIQTVHTGKSERVKLMLWGEIEVDDLWDDYKARTTRDLTIQIKKYDDVSNIMFTFTNCHIVSYERIGARYKGKYASVIKIDAEKVTEVSDWFTEGGITFADHWWAAI